MAHAVSKTAMTSKSQWEAKAPPKKVILSFKYLSQFFPFVALET
jgi:hypothetical protein